MGKKNKKGNSFEAEFVPEWDLTSVFYTGIDDPKIAEDIKHLKSCVKGLKEERDSIAKYKDYELLSFVRVFEEVVLLARKLVHFANLNAVTQLNNPEAAAFEAKMKNLTAEQLAELGFIHHELVKLPEEKKYWFLNSPKLKDYREWMIVNMLYIPSMSEAASKAVRMKDVVAGGWSAKYEEMCANLKFVMDGKEYPLAEIEHISKYDEDRDVRRKAQKVISDEFARNAHIFAIALNMILKDEDVSAKLYNCDSAPYLDALGNGLGGEDVLSVATAATDSYVPVSQRFYRLMQEMQKLDKMEYIDRCINPVKEETPKKYTWTECLGTVFSMLANFSLNCFTLGQTIVNNCWVDAKPKEGKRSGAFCVNSDTPFIMLSFLGGGASVKTFTHELGHGIHHLLCNQVGVLNDATTIGMSEVASQFMEELLFDKLYAEAKTNKDKLRLLIDNVSGHLSAVHRQIAFSKFEERAYRERRKGELTKEKFGQIYAEEMKRYLGFELEDSAKDGWMNVPHFFNSPFYVRYYAFADLIVLQLVAKYKSKELDNFESLYIDMLSNTGLEEFDELLEPFELDPNDDSFWTDAVDMISVRIDEIERLAKAEGLLA